MIDLVGIKEGMCVCVCGCVGRGGIAMLDCVIIV